jgi:hypothetical protein
VELEKKAESKPRQIKVNVGSAKELNHSQAPAGETVKTA